MSADELAMLRADIADYEALIAKWPKCPAGCNCRTGLPDDADANECGCDGPCNGAAIAAAAPAPPLDGDAAELATLRALRGVVFHFAETWAELLPDLPDSYGCEMNCAEANAAADLYRALGLDAAAGAIIATHIEHDDDEERENHSDGWIDEPLGLAQPQAAPGADAP